MKRRALILALVVIGIGAAVEAFYDLPRNLPPDQYGNILINRISGKNDVKPVAFSHWIHRRKHTCRVCHFELDFDMKVNSTEITEAANRAGQFCGAAGCHDGKTVFGHDKPNCEKCHNGDLKYGSQRFKELDRFPETRYGNHVDWVKALDSGLIKPLHYLTVKPREDTVFDKLLDLEAGFHNIPPAFYPHKLHTKWLDCNNCHPDVFNVKKKTTQHFSMDTILKGQFCGVCHLTVAFPMDDCKRCHPGKRF